MRSTCGKVNSRESRRFKSISVDPFLPYAIALFAGGFCITTQRRIGASLEGQAIVATSPFPTLRMLFQIAALILGWVAIVLGFFFLPWWQAILWALGLQAVGALAGGFVVMPLVLNRRISAVIVLDRLLDITRLIATIITWDVLFG